MEKIRVAGRWVLTGIVIPTIMYAFIQLDDVVTYYFRKGEVSDFESGMWRIVILVVIALAIMWLASRALVPKAGDASSLLVGLVLMVFVVESIHVFPIVYDMVMLPVLLVCFYVFALIGNLAGRVIA